MSTVDHMLWVQADSIREGSFQHGVNTVGRRDQAAI